jgi:hypothetical protein
MTIKQITSFIILEFILHRIGLKAKITIGVNSTNVINEHRQTKCTQASITKEKAGTETEMKTVVSERTISILLAEYPLCLHLSDFVLDES